VDSYIGLLRMRASGELLTTAQYLRQYVKRHPAYKHDSKLNQQVVYDMLEVCNQITKGERDAPELLGNYSSSSFTIGSDFSYGGDESDMLLRYLLCTYTHTHTQLTQSCTTFTHVNLIYSTCKNTYTFTLVEVLPSALTECKCNSRLFI
jgi:hypothetical protein